MPPEGAWCSLFDHGGAGAVEQCKKPSFYLEVLLVCPGGCKVKVYSAVFEDVGYVDGFIFTGAVEFPFSRCVWVSSFPPCFDCFDVVVEVGFLFPEESDDEF